MPWRVVRWAPVLGLSALWWWAVFRLALAPEAGVLEGAVAAGGWGLSLLPVHCVAKARAAGVARRRPPRQVTTASRRRRSGAGSDLS
ncbi:hypothetical protein [Streptomyces alboflavus]|uniref:hypothetical protein n=1 Tax=Streptomyces alboflavus TaxID=67267 RepID=UPI000F658FEA|nr:hypothetical protein [Streptomyces alboflavus]